ncbi:MAG TPA: hypothetical protein PLS90_13045, partial [Candidatus Sumerlaeota bacterium]|nr:hypothetical protein [Candidatus Sumerlaeota bacterium]
HADADGGANRDSEYLSQKNGRCFGGRRGCDRCRFHPPAVAWHELSGALVQRAWDLFRRHQIGTNDAFYCILAGDWGAEIWSQDGNFIDQALKSGINMHDLRAKAFS